MSKNVYEVKPGFIGFTILLTLILGILKLSGVIDISIWWVLSPVLFSFGLVIVLLLLIGLITAGAIVGSLDEVEKELDKTEENETNE